MRRSLIHEMILVQPTHYYPQKGNTITTHHDNNLLPIVTIIPFQPSIHLEFPRLKVHNPHILHNPLQTRHEFQMRRVLLEVVLPVFFGLKFAYEAMAETALNHPQTGSSN